jgi:hypothetical protein
LRAEIEKLKKKAKADLATIDKLKKETLKNEGGEEKDEAIEKLEQALRDSNQEW